MPTLLLRIYHGGEILQFDTGSSFLINSHSLLLAICEIPQCAYEKVHVDLLQSFLKIKLKAHSQLSENFLDKFCSSSFCAFNHLN